MLSRKFSRSQNRNLLGSKIEMFTLKANLHWHSNQLDNLTGAVSSVFNKKTTTNNKKTKSNFTIASVLMLFFAMTTYLVLLTKPLAAADLVILDTKDRDTKNLGYPETANACRLDGLIKKGDLEKIRNVISAHKTEKPCSIVYLNSPGGNLLEGLELSGFFFSSMIATSVEESDVCLSACSLIWLGGARPDGHNRDNPHTYRRIAPGGTLGFHAPFPLIPNDKLYSGADIEKSFEMAFLVMQKLNDIFYRTKVNLWFASNLMKPAKNDFVYIDDVEKAVLIGAQLDLPIELQNKVALDDLYTACFNLSVWGKGRTVDRAAESFSNNQNSYSTLHDYLAYLNSPRVEVYGVKYWRKLHYFLTELGRDEVLELAKTLGDESGWQERLQAANTFEDGARLISEKVEGVFPVNGSTFFLKDDLSYELGLPAGFFIFPSPGIVGPTDENIRDRPEFCAVRVSTGKIYDDLQGTLITSVGVRAYGTEVEHESAYNDLFSISRFPAHTKIATIESTLGQRLSGETIFSVEGLAPEVQSRKLKEALSCGLDSPFAEVSNVDKFTNLRRKAGLGNKIIARVPLGASVSSPRPQYYLATQRCLDACRTDDQLEISECIASNEIWVEVLYNDRRGFLSRKFLE